MKRFVLPILLILLLVLTLALPVSARDSLPLVVDQADVLTPEEQASLESMAQSIRREYEMDAVILTVDSLNGQPAQSFADHYYDSHGYGSGEDASGMLFLLSMEEQEWYISTCGNATYALTDYAIQALAEDSFRYLERNGYFGVFYGFYLCIPDYMDAYESGRLVDGYADYSGSYDSGTREETIYYEAESKPNVVLALLLGAIAASVTVWFMRSSMNTKHQQYNASDYLKSGTFHLRSRQDMFLYSNIRKVRRQQNTSSGGGSSVHRSSGGRRHGGGGGRF